MNLKPEVTEIRKSGNRVVTVGSFDGVHIGHKKILSLLVEKARASGCKSVVVTFEPHPRIVLSKDYSMKLLTLLDEKKKFIYEYGVDEIYVIPFTLEFSQQSSEEFFRNIIIEEIGVCEIIIGYDHKFGKDRDGDEILVKKLGKQFNFAVTLVDEVKVGEKTINSTIIRKLLENGDVSAAKNFLGRNYSISGKVVMGDKRGRELGFPTANISIADGNKLIPGIGVYAVKAQLRNQIYNGIMNIGNRPTFSDSKEVIIEVHLFDLAEEFYGEDITISFVERIRLEQKFSSKEELIEQINIDKAKALQIFK